MDRSASSLVSSADSVNSVWPGSGPGSGPGAGPAASASDAEQPLPLDLSHLFSETTKQRVPSRMKQYYKFFQVPGIANLAGGLPNFSFFPYDTLEAQTAKPGRYVPSPQKPVSADGTMDDDDDDAVVIAGQLATTSLATPSASASAGGGAPDPDAQAPAHLTIPKIAPVGLPLAPDRKIDLATALQYGGSDGYAPLLAWVREFVRNNLHPNVPYRGGPEVVMTVGATDGLSKTLELFVDNWNPVRDDVRTRPGMLVEPFIYGNAISQALPRGIQAVVVEADAGGMIAYGPGGLEDVLSNWDDSKGRRPHLLYNVTLGHNPTGIVLSVERRKQLYEVCSRFDVIIIEDDPYWHLQYPSAADAEAASRNLPKPKRAPAPVSAGQKSSGYAFLDSLVPSFLSIDVDGRVVRLDTFSKTVAPGCRVGWITAQPALVERYIRITEGTTSQPSGFVQSLISELVRGPLPAISSPDAAGKSTTIRNAKTARNGSTHTEFDGWQTDGWVRWLEGLRGAYERRMTEMCTILDEGAFQLKQGTPVRPSESDWGVITKTQLYSFAWPRAGMFLWLRMHFESHPLWQSPRSSGDGSVLDGPDFQLALLILLTTKPYLVLMSPGDMFSASPAVSKDRGWAFYRLCFAAESDDGVVSATKRVVAGIQKFWKIKRVRELEDLLDSTSVADAIAAAAANGAQNLGARMGC